MNHTNNHPNPSHTCFARACTPPRGTDTERDNLAHISLDIAAINLAHILLDITAINLASSQPATLPQPTTT
jgi:hypothetical protein